MTMIHWITSFPLLKPHRTMARKWLRNNRYSEMSRVLGSVKLN